MPIDNTKLKQLYDTLKEGGYKKDYNNFLRAWKRSEQRVERVKGVEMIEYQ